MPTSSPEDRRPQAGAISDAPAERARATWLNIAPDSRRAASGLEWWIWRRLPRVALAGTVLPLLVLGALHLAWGGPQATPAQLRQLGLADYITAGVLALHLTLLATVAIGCVIVMIMKGPHYTADSYRVPHRDRPGD